MYNNPISAEGRAIEARTQGMTPDQIQQVATQYDKLGLKSFDDVMTLKGRLDALKEQGMPKQPPATTVVQDMENEMQQMNGIAALPNQNVGNPRNYARGGIVAFSGADGSFVGTPDEELRRIGREAMDEANRAATEGVKEAGKGKGKGKVGPYKARVTDFLTKDRGSVKSLAGKGFRAVKGAYPWAAGATAIGEGFDVATGNPVPTENMREYYRNKGLTFIDPQAGDGLAGLAGDLGVRTLGTAQRVATLGLTGPDRDPAEAVAAADVPPTDEQYSPFDFSQFADSGAGGYEQYSGAGFTDADTSGFDAARETYLQKAARERATVEAGRMPIFNQLSDEAKQAGLGLLYQKERERLENDEAGLKGDERQGKWLAAADGFFEMAKAAGENGATFMGAAGAGGAKGTESWRQSMDKIEARRDKINDRRYEVNAGEEQFKSGLFNRADANLEAARARADSAESAALQAGIDKSKVITEVNIANAANQARIAQQAIAAGNRERALAAVKRAALIAQNLWEQGMKAPTQTERTRLLGQAREVANWVSELSASVAGYTDARPPTTRPTFGLPGTMPGTAPDATEQGWSAQKVE